MNKYTLYKLMIQLKIIMHKYTQNVLIIYLLISYQENNWIGTTQHEFISQTVGGSFQKLTDSVCTHLYKTDTYFKTSVSIATVTDHCLVIQLTETGHAPIDPVVLGFVCGEVYK